MNETVIEIDSAQVQDALRQLADPASLRAVMQAVGQDVRVAAVDHFRNRESEPERTDGFPKFGKSFGKTGFWSGNRGTSVAEAVGAATFDAADGSVTIPIDSPALAHKADPNPPPIKPKGGRRNLAIPANARAAMWAGMPGDYDIPGGMKIGMAPTADGRWMRALVARENFLRVVSKGKKAGQRAVAAAGKATTGAIEPQFWLVPQVRTRHDPRAMPNASVLTERATARAEKTISKLAPKE